MSIAEGRTQNRSRPTVPKPRQRAVTRPDWITPAHHGRRMSLALFDRAKVEPGYLYELNRGVIEVMDVPGISHGLIVQNVRNQFTRYQLDTKEISYIAGGNECKLLLPGVQSERHPDLAVYLLDAPDGVEQPWEIWVPAIAVEVVTVAQEVRDYEHKRQDYLAAGVLEYWIIDPQTQSMLALRRHGDVWVEHRVKRTGKYTTPLLSGFQFNLKAALAAATRGK